MRREVDDGRAVGAHRGQVLLDLVGCDSGSSRPLAAKITLAARIERSSRTYDVSRSASRSELQVITR